MPKSSNSDKLVSSIRALRASVDKSASFKRTFFLGIVRGIGAVIGATVFAGLILGLLASTFDTISSVPFIGEYFADISDMLKSTSTPTN